MPLGMGVELVGSEALLRAEAEAREPPEREHVCPYLYGHPELFLVDRSPRPRPNTSSPRRASPWTRRATTRCLLRIYGALFDGTPIPTSAIIAYLRSRIAASEGAEG